MLSSSRWFDTICLNLTGKKNKGFWKENYVPVRYVVENHKQRADSQVNWEGHKSMVFRRAWRGWKQKVNMVDKEAKGIGRMVTIRHRKQNTKDRSFLKERENIYLVKNATWHHVWIFFFLMEREISFLYWKIFFWNKILKWNIYKLFALAKKLERRRIIDKDLIGQYSLSPE